MNQFLQQRISAMAGMPMGSQAPMMMAEGGVINTDLLDTSDPEVQQELAEAEMMPQDPNEALRQTIEGLLGAAQTTEDPTERRAAEGLAEAAMTGSQAPMADMAVQLAQAGRGPDTQLAHVAPGEVILPPQVMADAEFEKIVGDRFAELNMNPEEYVVGAGIASLNPITGLEEFGWFKKTWKSVKKVAKKVIKPVAKVAQFIPGPWQLPAGYISKAYNVYDAFKSGNPMAGIAALGAPMPTGGGGFQIPGFGGGTLSFPGSGGISSLTNPTGGGSNILGSIYDYVFDAGDGKGLLTNLGETFGIGGDGKTAAEVLFEAAQNDPEIQEIIRKGGEAGLTPEQILAQNPYIGKGVLGSIGEFIFAGDDNKNVLQNLGGILGLGGGPQESGGLASMLGLGGQGGMGIGGLLGTAGLAGLFGKLAYDEAKDRKGVPLTPLTQMNAAGRYNIEAEIARRMGQPAPNPVEFGLLPNNFPKLSGGQPIAAGQQFTPRQILLAPNPNDINEAMPLPNYTPPTGMLPQPQPVPMFNQGGAVYRSEGGDMDGELFIRMTGDINGKGTEISDDIPAMLSDGEFVMTGRAVRGAGAFDMKNQDGIVTLTPMAGEDKEKGIDMMYKMMDLFSEFARPPQAKGA